MSRSRTRQTDVNSKAKPTPWVMASEPRESDHTRLHTEGVPPFRLPNNQKTPVVASSQVVLQSATTHVSPIEQEDPFADIDFSTLYTEATPPFQLPNNKKTSVIASSQVILQSTTTHPSPIEQEDPFAGIDFSDMSPVILSPRKPKSTLLEQLQFQDKQVLSQPSESTSTPTASSESPPIEIRNHLMKPLLEYANAQAERYRQHWFGGDKAAVGVSKAVARLSSLPDLLIYRWSGALIPLLLEKEATRYQARYEALLIDWLADGGSASLGDALRNTPMHWLTSHPNNAQLAHSVLKEHASSEGFALPQKEQILEYLINLPPYVSALAQFVLRELALCANAIEKNANVSALLKKGDTEATDFFIAINTLSTRLLEINKSLSSPSVFAVQVTEALRDFYNSWRGFLLNQGAEREVQQLLALEQHLRWLPHQMQILKMTMQRILEGILIGAYAVTTAAQRKLTLEERLLASMARIPKLSGGTHSLLSGGSHLISGLQVGETLLSTLEFTKGVGELSESVLGIFEETLAHSLRHWVEQKTNIISVDTQFTNIVEAFQSLKHADRLECLIAYLCHVYGDSLALLTPDSQTQWVFYVLGMVLAYIKYGLFQDKKGIQSAAAFAKEAVSWLVFADYTLLTQSRFARVTKEISLTLQDGSDVPASALLSQAGVIAQDTQGNWCRFWYGQQNPGRYGYRLALPCEVSALNEFIQRGKRSGETYVFGSGKTAFPTQLYYGNDLQNYLGDFQPIPFTWQSPEKRLEKVEERYEILRDTQQIDQRTLYEHDELLKALPEQIATLLQEGGNPEAISNKIRALDDKREQRITDLEKKVKVQNTIINRQQETSELFVKALKALKKGNLIKFNQILEQIDSLETKEKTSIETIESEVHSTPMKEEIATGEWEVDGREENQSTVPQRSRGSSTPSNPPQQQYNTQGFFTPPSTTHREQPQESENKLPSKMSHSRRFEGVGINGL